MRTAIFLMLATALAGACVPPPSTSDLPADLTAALVARSGDTPPEVPPGACWASDVTPAVIETVTEQVQVTPERRAADGGVAAPATYRSDTRQQIVTERRAVWFEVPCPETLTVEFVASLQRALKARGLFSAALTGEMDEATARAVRAWQRPRGLDSGTLALATARALGLVAVPRP